MKNKVAVILSKWSLAFKVLPLLVMIIAFKFAVHYNGWEFFSLNSLFTSLVAGTIFLIGFLIAGVLSDYKESEKIPSELSACLESLYDESYTILKVKNSDAAIKFIEFQKSFVYSLNKWFYKKERTQKILVKVSSMSDFFVEFEKEGLPPVFITKMKNEQNNIRKIILRIHTIRDTNFISSAYAIVEALAFFIVLGMILIKIEPFYESLFFTVLVTFLVTYMLFLIKDIDNPFDYSSHGESGTEISLKPLHDWESRLKEIKA